MITQQVLHRLGSVLFLTIALSMAARGDMPFLLNGPLPPDRTMWTSSESAMFQEPASPWLFEPRDQSPSYSQADLYRRQQIAEQIGNQGTALFAKQHGLTKILGSSNRSIRQGVDAYYRDSAGYVYAFESKGGMSQPKESYGYMQGTLENAIKATERTMRSPATRKELGAYEEFMGAAMRGKARAVLNRTPHGGVGTPFRPFAEGLAESTPGTVALARKTVGELVVTHPELPEAQRLARVRGTTNSVVGGGMNAGFGVLLLAQSTIVLHDLGLSGVDWANMPEIGQQAVLFAAGTSMVVSGGAAMGTLLTTESSQLQTLNSISKWGGRAGLVFVVASEGFVLWQYAEGHITRDDAIRSTGRLAGALVGAWAGGELGGAVGSLGGPIAPVTVPVGAAVGTIGGALAGAYAADVTVDVCLTYNDAGRRDEMVDFLIQYYSR